MKYALRAHHAHNNRLYLEIGGKGMVIGWRRLTHVAGRITEVEIPSAAACGGEQEEQPNGGHQEPTATAASRLRFHRDCVGLTHYPKSRFSSSLITAITAS